MPRRMNDVSAIFFALGEGLLENNEQAIIEYCTKVLAYPVAERERHYSCISAIYYSFKCVEDRQDLQPCGMDCNCEYCDHYRKEFFMEAGYQCSRPQIAPPPLKKDRKTNLYVMRNHRNGFIKLGRAEDPIYRELTLQAEEPEIAMLFYFPATVDREKELHNLFAKQRVRGEWFRLTEDDIEYIRKEFSRGLVDSLG